MLNKYKYNPNKQTNTLAIWNPDSCLISLYKWKSAIAAKKPCRIWGDFIIIHCESAPRVAIILYMKLIKSGWTGLRSAIFGSHSQVSVPYLHKEEINN